MPKAPHVQCSTRFSCEGALAKNPAFFKFFEVLKVMLRWAERVFTPSGARAQRGLWSEEVKNREGVASGSATKKMSSQNIDI